MYTAGDLRRRRAAVRAALPGRQPHAVPGEARAFASANIALVKYWGKRDEALHLPRTGSLSVSLGPWGSEATLALTRKAAEVWLDGEKLAPGSSFAARALAYLELFRPESGENFVLKTRNTLPTAAGFASSASGFAAIAKALDALFGWDLPERNLSVLARLGSGSAARSLRDGFVEWKCGRKADGSDSYAVALPVAWKTLRIGAVVVERARKPLSSGEAMRRCIATSPFMAAWDKTVRGDLRAAKEAVAKRDLRALGEVAEGNALAMHAVMLAARESVFYPTGASLAALAKVRQLRAEGVPVYATMDAGPNVKLLFEAKSESPVRRAFPDAVVLCPFADKGSRR
ncbi:MAG: diphosphomevalonate decarboxylase [Kiritimatiellae bacterium]|nr:diphosphomevalonate decarboxylase [Kiritimatiellia bacterium]